MRTATILMGAAALLLIPALASAVVFSTNFDDATGLTVLGTADSSADFNWDYSTVGVPQNPNSSDTTALRLAANVSAGAVNEIAVVTSGLSLTTPYKVTFDFWGNANGPLPAGGTGSTEFAGGVAGHDGSTIGLNGASLIIAGEGGSSRDWRLYKDADEQFVASGQYNPVLASNNAAEPAIAGAFPGNAPPAAQTALYANQTGAVQDGSGGFAWRTMTINVFSDGASFYVDNFYVGTIDPAAGNPVSMTGEAGVIYADLFASVSDEPAMSFGLFDNMEISVIPEPATMILLGLGGFAALLRRRR